MICPFFSRFHALSPPNGLRVFEVTVRNGSHAEAGAEFGHWIFSALKASLASASYDQS
jgi:hypothetical protein